MSMTNEEIEQVFRQMHERITDAFLRFEALRVTLEQSHSPEFHQRFESNLADLEKRWAQSFEANLTRTLEEQNRELMRLLLERHEGTKQ